MELATFHKLLGKVFIKALLLGLLPAAQPFYTAADLRDEPALEGTFGPERPSDPVVSDAARETLRIAKSDAGPHLYSLALSNSEGTIEFDARLFRLAGPSGAPVYFLDLAPRRDKERRFPALMRHSAVRVELNDDLLEFSFPLKEQLAPEAAALAAQVSSERKKDCERDLEPAYSAGSYCTRVLTAPTKALQSLLRGSVKKKLFSEFVSLYRIKPPVR